MNTRFICTGSTLMVIGSTAQPRFVDPETGTLGQFRHQYFLLFLVALPATAMTLYAVLRSRRLSDFLDTLSDERKPARAKYDALGNVFRRRSRPQR